MYNEAPMASDKHTTGADQGFFDRVSPVFQEQKYPIPPSPLTPEQRQQRRFARRNERKLYKRPCDLTGETIISFYRPDAPFTIYSHDAWWSDKWDPMQYGRDIDFNRPFFEQFAELQKEVPRIGMVVHTCENCEFAPYSVRSRNCYMCISCKESEDLRYCYQTHFSKDCIDCSLCFRMELCYQCLYCTGLFGSQECKDCENGSSLYFCEDCRGCNNCIGCKNLSQKNYHILNQPVSKEEFERVKEELKSFTKREQWRTKAKEFFLTLPTRHAHLINCELSTGDHLLHCKNALHCFDCSDLEDCRFSFTSPGHVKDSQDFDYSPEAELCYDCLSVVGSYMALFCLHSWECKNILYTDECFSSKNLFGCIGLRNKEYCILNKQYSEGDYEELAGKLASHMLKTGEWGNYFPLAIAPFAYNETIAQTFYPLDKAKAKESGLLWIEEQDEPLHVEKKIPAERLPDTVDQIPDDILHWAITGMKTERPFKLIPQELTFYREQGIPIPRYHQEERYSARMALSNPRTLYKRQCMKTGQEIWTTYAPNRPEVVYSEEAYLAEVY